jgi:hypothetical protein
MSSKQFWKGISIITRFPTEGYVHFIFADDTEDCFHCSEIESKLKNKTPVKPITFTEVDLKYKTEFDNGGNIAVDDLYLLCSEQLREIDARNNSND